MNPLLFVAFLAIGASAQYYGQSQPQINVRVEEAPRSSYAAPQRQQQSYSAPAPQRQDSYSSSSYNSQPIRQQEIPILRFNQDIRGSQANNVDFETGNGIRSTMNTQETDAGLQQSGHSYHEAPEGMHIALTWTADKNGFQPTGDHLPQPVEMPADHAEAHRQALAVAAANPPSYEDESYNRGSSYSSSSYSAPQQPIRVQSYSAPQPAPVRVQSYSAPAVRSGY